MATAQSVADRFIDGFLPLLPGSDGDAAAAAKADVAAFIKFNTNPPMKSNKRSWEEDAGAKRVFLGVSKVGIAASRDLVSREYSIADIISGDNILRPKSENFIHALSLLCLLRHCATIEPICDVRKGLVGVEPERIAGSGFPAALGDAAGRTLSSAAGEDVLEANANLMATDLLQALVFKQFSASAPAAFMSKQGFTAAGSIAALNDALPAATSDDKGKYLCELMNFLVGPRNTTLGSVTASSAPSMVPLVPAFTPEDWSDLLRPLVSLKEGSRLGRFALGGDLEKKSEHDGVALKGELSGGVGSTVSETDASLHGVLPPRVVVGGSGDDVNADTAPLAFTALRRAAKDESVTIPFPVLVTAIH